MILFLKENHDLWDIKDVVEANRRRKAANKESRAAKRIAEEEDNEALATALGLIATAPPAEDNQNNN